MSHTIRYRSSRREVWRWYRQAWKKRLWRLHFGIAVAFGFVLSGATVSAANAPSWFGYSVMVFLSAVVLSALVPQFLFKAEERTLEVNPEGWATKIGTKSGAIDWRHVASIQKTDESIVIQGTNGNALIVPTRAFASSQQRESFLNDVKQWHRERRG
jgi:YcxB-like protein